MMSFDIKKHKWSDLDIKLDRATEYTVFINVNYVHECSNEILKAGGYLKKQDAAAIFKHLGDKEQAIEIAKHFGLTAGDLKDEWISVDDKLPEVEGNYIYYYKNRPYYNSDFGICWYSKKYGFDFCGVTHWRPLLQPPQSKEQEEK